MLNFLGLKNSRRPYKTKNKNIRNRMFVFDTTTNLQIVLKTPKNLYLNKAHQKILVKFSYPKKSFTRPRHLKSSVPGVYHVFARKLTSHFIGEYIINILYTNSFRFLVNFTSKWSVFIHFYATFLLLS